MKCVDTRDRARDFDLISSNSITCVTRDRDISEHDVRKWCLDKDDNTLECTYNSTNLSTATPCESWMGCETQFRTTDHTHMSTSGTGRGSG